MMSSSLSFRNKIGRASFVVLPLLLSVFGANAAPLETFVCEHNVLGHNVLDHKISDVTYQQDLLFVYIHKGNDSFYVVLEKSANEYLKETEIYLKMKKTVQTLKCL